MTDILNEPDREEFGGKRFSNVPKPPITKKKASDEMDVPKPQQQRPISQPSRPASQPAYQERQMQPSFGSYPPLFIKVERYEEIMQSIQRLKSTALSLRDALDAMNDMEKELRTGLNVIQKALDNFNSAIGNLDSKIMRMDAGMGNNPAPRKEQPPANELDNYVSNVYDQIDKLRREMKSV